MALSYASPGVYVEEVDKGTKPIEPVGTSLAAFVGITSQASLKAYDLVTGNRVVASTCLNKPTLVTNWTQFVDIFGNFHPGAFLPEAVYGFFANGGSAAYVTSILALDEGGEVKAAEKVIPSASKPAFKVTAKVGGPQGNELVVTVKMTGEDNFALTIGNETVAGLTMKKGDTHVGSAQFTQATISEVGPVNALPVEGSYVLEGGGVKTPSVADFIGDAAARTGIRGLEAFDDIRLLLCPDIMNGYDGSEEAKQKVKMVQTEMIAQCEKLRYRFAVLDTPPGLSAQQAKEWRFYVNFDSSYAAMYYPWITIADLSGSGKATKSIPPSGHVVGIYNRSDADRGVHKAPANEVILGAIDMEIHLSRGEQDTLNPIGVNCIRTFPGRGIRVWGSRTLSSNGAWRYVNVRRVFIMVEASMDSGLQWVVFEPNDSNLWAKVRRDVSAFLKVVWRSGALFGASPEQAFYVKCDEELNPNEIRDIGQLIIEVGMAPVKPAEFVIFRISQWAGANAE